MNDHPKRHHEDLDSYRASIEFAALAADLVQRLPRGHSTIADPLSRAAFSIPLNIAEGYGKRSEADRSRSYATGLRRQAVATVQRLAASSIQGGAANTRVDA